MTAVPVMEWDAEAKCMVQATTINEKGEVVGIYQFDSSGAIKATIELGKLTGSYEKDNKQKESPVTVIMTGSEKVKSEIDKLGK